MAIMEAIQDQGLVSAGYNKQIQLNTRMVKKSEKNKYRDLIRNGGIATGEMPASVFENRVKAKAESCENLDKDRRNMRSSLSAKKSDWDTKKANLSGLTETDSVLRLAGIERDSSVIAHQSAVDALAIFQAANPAPVSGTSQAAVDAKAAVDAAAVIAADAQAAFRAAEQAYTYATVAQTNVVANQKLIIKNNAMTA
jgi:hypothetical protein